VISSYDIAKEVLRESQDTNNNKMRSEVEAQEDSAPSNHTISGHWTAIKKYSEERLPYFKLGAGYTVERVVEEEISKTICIMKEQIHKRDGMTQIPVILNESITSVVRDIIEGSKNCAQDYPTLENVHSNYIENSKELEFFESSLLTVWNNVFQRRLKNLKTSQNGIERTPREGTNGSLQDIHSNSFLKTSDNIEDNCCNLNTLKEESVAIMENVRNILRFLSLHPQVQRNCQNEIDSRSPRVQIPTLNDIKQYDSYGACYSSVYC